jgi:DNA polymerase III epsilon subunit-like protein
MSEQHNMSSSSSSNVFINRFLMWDVESTSKNPTVDDIISLGCVLCELNSNGLFEKLGEFHTFVYTNKTIDAVAQSIHHISKEDLMGEPSFPNAINLLRTFVQQLMPEPNSRLIMIAHNGSAFDDIMLYCNFVQHRLVFDQFMKDIKCHGFLDSYKLFKALYKDCGYHEKPQDPVTTKVSFKLGDCASSFCGESIANAHNALADSQALFNIFNSNSVQKRCNLQLMFTHVVSRQKAVKWIKQTAGVTFQNQEEHTRNLLMDLNGEPAMVDDSQSSNDPTLPIFEEVHVSTNPNVRLCLNCMTFTTPLRHTRCDREPQQLPHKQPSF